MAATQTVCASMADRLCAIAASSLALRHWVGSELRSGRVPDAGDVDLSPPVDPELPGGAGQLAVLLDLPRRFLAVLLPAPRQHGCHECGCPPYMVDAAGVCFECRCLATAPPHEQSLETAAVRRLSTGEAIAAGLSVRRSRRMESPRHGHTASPSSAPENFPSYTVIIQGEAA